MVIRTSSRPLFCLLLATPSWKIRKIHKIRKSIKACTICEKKRGAGKFNKYARWDQSRRNSELICDDCIDMRFSAGNRTFFIAVISTMSDLTLTNGECEDRHGPKGLSIAEHVWMFHNGPSVLAVLYW